MMIKPVICFEMLFGKDDPVLKINRIAEAGFKYVEFWSWRDKDIKAIKSACDSTGIEVVNFSGQRAGDLVNTDTHKAVVDDYRDALKAAEILGNQILMVLTNELGEEGVVVNPYEEIAGDVKDKALVRGLEMISSFIPPEGTVVLEPLNTVKDHVGYYLDNLDKAAEILDKVGDSRIKILCDLYHQGMMGDDLVSLVKRHGENIGYFHIADIPGRGEPGSGSMDWESVLIEIKNSGYDGYIGFEYSPARDSAESLSSIKALWDLVF